MEMKPTSEALEYYTGLHNMLCGENRFIPHPHVDTTLPPMYRDVILSRIKNVNRDCMREILNIANKNSFAIDFDYGEGGSVWHDRYRVISPPPEKYDNWEYFIYNLLQGVFSKCMTAQNDYLINYFCAYPYSFCAKVGAFLICYKLGRHKKHLDKKIIYHVRGRDGRMGTYLPERGTSECLSIVASVVDEIMGLPRQMSIRDLDLSRMRTSMAVVDWEYV